ncbi:cation/calcium exchanger 1-like [Coffea arabica]|uniref:Cation/calcium exchanger 1-like n=1 Tax=Coffea arabica TaxID=13443 RepID=A0A6P6SNX3_COFAR|nr:cation/calcium exchanger 1-like [Coffea arabica]
MDCFSFISRFRTTLVSLLLNISFLFFLVFYITTNVLEKPSFKLSNSIFFEAQGSHDCSSVRNFTDYKSQCAYVISFDCSGKGYIDYLQIFYCSLGQFPVLGYTLLLLWLLLLFYVIGNTTADYFCPSVESLSRVLKLSPTIAGTTLLPLGNGANDVFASFISFAQSHDSDVGINTVLGGAFFISCFVVGIVSMSISSRQVAVDEASFIRDVLFLIFSLVSLLMIIISGEINLWVATGYVSIYVLYIMVVSAMQFFYGKKERIVNPPAIIPPSSRSNFLALNSDESCGMYAPLIEPMDEEKNESQSQLKDALDQLSNGSELRSTACRFLRLFLYVLELPLQLPRQITIPTVSEEKWSKAFAVTSATLAPIFLALIWKPQIISSTISLAIFMSAALLGIILGTLAFAFTKKSSPPKDCLFPWLAGGFLMSIAWTYLIAEELVCLLVSFGTILGINPSILGLTVLAWGNSAGDLISNLAMALKGGPDGVQIAISGCYAGPLFNNLIGLGLSLIFASWSQYPSSYLIPKDPYLYETVGFFIAGLLWAIVILLNRKMKLDRSLGGGLVAIYLCFIFLRLAKALGLPKLGGSLLEN